MQNEAKGAKVRPPHKLSLSPKPHVRYPPFPLEPLNNWLGFPSHRPAGDRPPDRRADACLTLIPPGEQGLPTTRTRPGTRRGSSIGLHRSDEASGDLGSRRRSDVVAVTGYEASGRANARARAGWRRPAIPPPRPSDADRRRSASGVGVVVPGLAPRRPRLGEARNRPLGGPGGAEPGTRMPVRGDGTVGPRAPATASGG